MNLETTLKIEYIGEDFRKELELCYPQHKDNCKIHRQRAASLKEERKKKRGVEKKIKLKKEHLKFIKGLLDDESLQEWVCLRTIV